MSSSSSSKHEPREEESTVDSDSHNNQFNNIHNLFQLEASDDDRWKKIKYNNITQQTTKSLKDMKRYRQPEPPSPQQSPHPGHQLHSGQLSCGQLRAGGKALPLKTKSQHVRAAPSFDEGSIHCRHHSESSTTPQTIIFCATSARRVTATPQAEGRDSAVGQSTEATDNRSPVTTKGSTANVIPVATPVLSVETTKLCRLRNRIALGLALVLLVLAAVTVGVVIGVLLRKSRDFHSSPMPSMAPMPSMTPSLQPVRSMTPSLLVSTVPTQPASFLPTSPPSPPRTMAPVITQDESTVHPTAVYLATIPPPNSPMPTVNLLN